MPLVITGCSLTYYPQHSYPCTEAYPFGQYKVPAYMHVLHAEVAMFKFCFFQLRSRSHNSLEILMTSVGQANTGGAL